MAGFLLASHHASLLQFHSAGFIQVSINLVCEISWSNLYLDVSKWQCSETKGKKDTAIQKSFQILDTK